jgi:hypothetical protein
LVGRNKEFSNEWVFSKEVNQSTSPINYVLMVIDNIESAPVDELALTEAELFIKRLFVQGDYKNYADKFQINRDDLKRILYEASAFLGRKKNIPCAIALILKTVKEEYREVIVSRTGTGASFIINSQEVRILVEDSTPSAETITPASQSEPMETPQLFTGKLKKEDTLLLCSESLSAVLDLNFMQRTVIASKGPEEVCKKLLHSASGTGRKVNISVAAYNGAVIRRNPDKERISTKTLLFISIPVILILIGFLIYNLASGSKEKPVETSPVETFESLKLPQEIRKDSIVQPSDISSQIPADNDNVKKPEDNAKKIKKETIKKPLDIVKKINNVNFIVNGSVVMISNWESVKEDILQINWDNGITDKKSIHKYPDYTSIPSTVKITYKDKTTKSYKVK